MPSSIYNFVFAPQGADGAQGELAVPTDETTTESMAGAGNGDFLEGGAGGNAFGESGDNFEIVTEGNKANQIEISPATGKGSGQTIYHGIYFTSTVAGSSPGNWMGLSPDSTDNLVISSVAATSVSNAYLQIAGTETNLNVYGEVQYVSLSISGGTLELGDMSALSTFVTFIIQEDSGLDSSSPLTIGSPNTIIMDGPASGAAANIVVGGYPVYEGINGAAEFNGIPPFYDLVAGDFSTDTEAVFQGLTNQDTVYMQMQGGSAYVNSPEETGLVVPTLGDLGLEQIDFNGGVPVQGEGRKANSITIYGGAGDSLVMSPDSSPPGSLLTDNQTTDGETVGGIDLIGTAPGDTTTIYGGMPPAGDFLTYTDSFDIDASYLSGNLNLIGGYGSLATQELVNDYFLITNVSALLSTYMVGGGAANTFYIEHNGGLNSNITIVGGPGGAATDTLVVDRTETSKKDPDSLTFSAGTSPLVGNQNVGVQMTGTDTSIFEYGVYTIDVGMHGGTLDVNDLIAAGSYNVNVVGLASPAGNPNHIIIEAPNSYGDGISVDTGLTIDDAATETDYSIIGLVAQDDVRIKLRGYGIETVNNLQTLGPYTLIFDGSAEGRRGSYFDIPMVVPDFALGVDKDSEGDTEFVSGRGTVVFHDPIAADQFALSDESLSGTTNYFDVADASALVGSLEIGGSEFGTTASDLFEVDATPTANLAITLHSGFGANVYDLDDVGNNEGITIDADSGTNELILDHTGSSSTSPYNLTLSAMYVEDYRRQAVIVTGQTTSAVVIGVLDIEVNMYGGTLDVGDLAAVGATNIVVTGKSHIPNDPNEVVVEPPAMGAPDNLDVVWAGGLDIGDTATDTTYLVTGFGAQDDVQIKLNGGGSETVDDLDMLGYGLIFDGSDRSGGGNTLNVQLETPGFVATMATDAAGDPQLQDANALLSFHGSISTDHMNLEDEVPLGTPGKPTDTFKIDDSALQGTLNLVGSKWTPVQVADTFEVTNTPITGLTTELTGGTGPNVFDIVHGGLNILDGGINRGIVVSGGSGSNELVLDRSQSSAGAPDSVTLATPDNNMSSPTGQVQVTGTATSFMASNVYNIQVNMYGGTLNAGDLGPAGKFTVDVTGEASPDRDANHVVIEPPLGNERDNVTVLAGMEIEDTATSTSYNIGLIAAQDDVRIMLNGSGRETVNNIETLGPSTLIFDGSARSLGGNALNVPLTEAFLANFVTDAAGDPELQENGGGFVAFHGSIPTDQWNIIDRAASNNFGNTINVDDDSALEGTLELIGGPDTDDFNVYNTAAANLTTELVGGAGQTDFYIQHGGVNENIAVIGGTGVNDLFLDRPQTSAAAPDLLAVSSGSTSPGGPADVVDITGTETSITASGVFAFGIDMYGGTLDAGDLGPLGSQATYLVHALASPTGDPNHVIIEPPVDNAPDNITVLSGPIVADTATDTDYFFEDLAAQDDIRIKLNGGGSETVDDLPTVGPENLIFDGSNRSGGSNTLNVPIALSSFALSMATDAAGDPQLKDGGVVSFHGSTPADVLTVSDQVTSGSPRTFDSFQIDDSALEGTLKLVGNQSTSDDIKNSFTVTSTPSANLATDLIGGTGPNYFDIVHDAVNQGISVTGGPGLNSLTVDRDAPSAPAPDSLAITAIQSEPDPELQVTGTTTSVIATGLFTVDANMNGGTLDVGGLSLLGGDSLTVTGSPSAPTDVTLDATSLVGFNLTLGDGSEGYDSFQWGLPRGVASAIDLQQNSVELTLELPTTESSNLVNLTVNDTGLLPTTIDEGPVPTIVAGTTGPLTLQSNDPGSITIGLAGSVQGLNGAVNVLTTTPTSSPTRLVVDDSADTKSESVDLGPRRAACTRSPASGQRRSPSPRRSMPSHSTGDRPVTRLTWWTPRPGLGSQ